MLGCFCNALSCVGILDYAYLATNVYHDHKQDYILGMRPVDAKHMDDLIGHVKEGKEGWAMIDFVTGSPTLANEFYAEFYVKIYEGKIHHLMVAFRGTVPSKIGNLLEDAVTWGSNALFTNYMVTPTPTFFAQVVSFLSHVCDVIADLDAHDLLANYVVYHLTGHSLGGALANMVAARSMHLTPASTKAHIPIIHDVITFNPPGIGAMYNYSDKLPQYRTISMRAQYDLISRVGAPYGYIVDNVIPEGFEQCQKAMLLGETLLQNNVEELANLPEDLLMKPVDRILKMGLLAYEGRDFLEQHSMANMLNVIRNQINSPTMDLVRVRSWADKHNGLNHDFAAAPLWGDKVLSQAA